MVVKIRRAGNICRLFEEDLSQYRGEYEDCVDYLPEILFLLAELLRSESLEEVDRLKVAAALGYSVSPLDMFPEEIYTPYSFLGDLFVSLTVLRDVVDAIGLNTVENLWRGEVRLFDLLEDCYNRVSKELGAKKKLFLKHVGLDLIG
jgi:uncharacterized membrane protein YkvA (DUF1232 family)